MLFLEYAADTDKRSGLMLPYYDVSKKTGFRSVYAYDQAAAETIRAQRNSRGFDRFVPYACDLFVDLDSFDFVEEAEKNIEALGWKYSSWRSGSKGMHFHIPHSLAFGHGLLKKHLEMAQMVSPHSDTSLYRYSSLFRLPGTIHRKTGKPKHFVKSGGRIACPIHGEYAGEAKNDAQTISFDNTSESELLLSLGAFQGFYGRQPMEGRRFQTLWSIGKGLAEGGLTSVAVREMLVLLNDSWPNAKDELEIDRAIKDVFKL